MSTTDFLVYSRSFSVNEYSNEWAPAFVSYRKLVGVLSYLLITVGILGCVLYVFDLTLNKRLLKLVISFTMIMMIALALSILITSYTNKEIFARYDETKIAILYSTSIALSGLSFGVFVNGAWGFVFFGITLLLLSIYSPTKDFSNGNVKFTF